MPAPDWENPGDFLNTDDFAITATITSKEGGRVRLVRGIFDEQYVNRDLGEYDMDAGSPRLTCKECDVAGLKKHDECKIASIPGVTFELTEDPKPDGTGFATLFFARFFD